ncbi:hypothetical protein [Burkholderia sp. ABCPW 11]|uniref:hypothetical protein n=1 Tax=Burkholderia sp. ABCPW 11 TaxID=1637859 RepID=UPI000AF9F5D7|nr:hypothetical protein [Burkholderia sp. ABCPW 11]
MHDTVTRAALAERQFDVEPFREAAAAAFDRIVGDCLDREWIIAPPPQPNKARHGKRNSALDRRIAESLDLNA